jgi:hypothetical protein
MFPRQNLHEYTWTYTDGKIYNQIYYILVGRRWHSSTLDVRPLKETDYDTDHYLVIAKVREKLVASKHRNLMEKVLISVR